MDNMAPITYRDFWDVPRVFIASYRGERVLFDCAFDEAAEDYPGAYRVYLLPGLRDEDLAGSWDKLHAKASRYLGEIPVREVRFDPTRRQAVDADVLEKFLAPPGNARAPVQARGA
jgi:hypothetical protein